MTPQGSMFIPNMKGFIKDELCLLVEDVLGEHRFPSSNGVTALAICRLIIFIASNFESQTKYIYLSLFFFNLRYFQNINEDVWGPEHFLFHCIRPSLAHINSTPEHSICVDRTETKLKTGYSLHAHNG